MERYRELTIFLACAIVVHCAFNKWFGIYRFIGRYVGFHQALKIVQASALAVVALLLIAVVVKPASSYHALVVVPIGGILVMLISGGVRFYPRIFYQRSLKGVTSQANILIVGAGNAGERMVTNIQKDRLIPMTVVAVVDDNPALFGKEMHGVPIYGPVENICRVVARENIDEILIAIPSARIEQFNHIWQICSCCDVPVKTVGSLQSTHHGEVGVREIREIRIEDVLGRQPVQTDYAQISEFIQDKTVVVTGAGGSIGSELVIQIAEHDPGRIVLIDQDETALYNMHERLTRRHFQNYEMFVADIKSEIKMTSIFRDTRPDIVFHAAAYKHVPLMEMHPDEGVLNNVMGTLNIATVSGKHGVDSFVNISTDKAVDPINILGATKRLGERLVAELDDHYPNTRFCSVRFGNVLGSRGSVIPIFRDQINKGGPITITDPQMTRYFMMISEAVDLVLQAAAFREGNSIYVLDMGEPVKIVDLAAQMVEFMQSEKKIEMVYTGLRPGEKLHETLFEGSENAEASAHEKINRVNPFHWGETLVLGRLSLLFEEARANDHRAIRRLLKEWLPTYKPFEMENIGLVADAAPEAGTAGVSGVSYTGASSLNYNWQNADRDDEGDELADDAYEAVEDDSDQLVTFVERRDSVRSGGTRAAFTERRRQQWTPYERTLYVDRRQRVLG